MKYFLLLFVLVAASCDVSRTETQARDEWWEKELSELMKSMPSMEAVLVRLSSYSPTYNRYDNSISITELAAGDGVVCTQWQFDITIYGNDKGFVEKTAKSMVGVCL